MFSGNTPSMTDDRFDYGELRRISAASSIAEWSWSHGLKAAWAVIISMILPWRPKKAVTQNSSAANRRMIPMMHLNCWTFPASRRVAHGWHASPARPVALSLANRNGDYA
jgi:hypothetical protein